MLGREVVTNLMFFRVVVFIFVQFGVPVAVSLHMKSLVQMGKKVSTVI